MYSKQHNLNKPGSVYQNVSGASAMSFREGMRLLPKFLFKTKNRVPNRELPIIKKKIIHDDKAINAHSLTWLGHSSVLIEMNGKTIFIDPHLSQTASPIPFFVKKFYKKPALDLESVLEIDVLLISHDHYDHLDYKSIKRLKDKIKIALVPRGVKKRLISWGVQSERVMEFNWFDEIEIEKISFICVPAQHFSGRGLFDRNTTLWCSWIVKDSFASFFFSGDSGYFNGFKEIGNKFGGFDICMIECGQYNERWRSIHMLPEDVIKSFNDLGGKYLMPIHWGGFALAFHEWDEPINRIYDLCQKHSVPLLTPQIGESVLLGKNYISRKWWGNETTLYNNNSNTNL
ncbi:hypothetical protein CHS0354_023907 [Potamilus streckersoni]|uniref:Metallo-beta-lactamase domain-containing protein n=1 Tax=Potamilus streckersoni TaxID=2493646 RepID=A0AAE0RZE3_9BIVA|nr:hypothetical protein CHS0354_023907 [Potamilus streckersoni]